MHKAGLKKEANDYAEVAKRWPTCRMLPIKKTLFRLSSNQIKEERYFREK